VIGTNATEDTTMPDSESVSIEAVLIETPNPEALAEFYRAGFELATPKAYGDDHLGLTLPGGGYLGFDGVAAPKGAPPGRVRVWFRTSEVEITFERLMRLGGSAVMAPSTDESPGEILATLADPEGNIIGLIYPTEAST
jgi:predicted enzyme related to lactoylglutathione lyase